MDISDIDIGDIDICDIVVGLVVGIIVRIAVGVNANRQVTYSITKTKSVKI